MPQANTITAYIPARYASTRLPGKPLIEICGKALLSRVWEAATSSAKLSNVIVATDDDRIAALCNNIGADNIMTPSDLPSGTDRIKYAYDKLKDNSEIILNIQGDEPLLTGNIIDKLIDSFIKSGCDAGTLITKITSPEELTDPAVVKVICTNDGKALYFSRTPLPFLRDFDRKSWHLRYTFYKHVGIYIFKSQTLNDFVSLPSSDLEKAEKLEQLRLLQNGYTINCVEIEEKMHGVDTLEDLDYVRGIIGEPEK